MGLFARKKPEDGARAEQGAGLQEEYRQKQDELNGIRQKIEMVKEEYQETVGRLMGVKKELNQKRAELDSVLRKAAEAAEAAKRTAEITGTESVAEFKSTAEGLSSMREELEAAAKKLERTRSEIASGQSALRIIRGQHSEYKKELEEAGAKLYNAKEELARTRFHGSGALSDREREAIGSGQGPGVIEAASAVVASLKSKLNRAQKELETVQSLLEKERAAHEETRRKLGSGP